MTPTIQEKTVWQYIGPGDGQGLRHTVTEVQAGTVTTWSDPSPEKEVGGYSWRGDAETFRKHFRWVGKGGAA
jgi:hypothetical protein